MPGFCFCACLLLRHANKSAESRTNRAVKRTSLAYNSYGGPVYRNLALFGMTQQLEDTGSPEPRTGFKSGHVKMLTLYKH